MAERSPAGKRRSGTGWLRGDARKRGSVLQLSEGVVVLDTLPSKYPLNRISIYELRETLPRSLQRVLASMAAAIPPQAQNELKVRFLDSSRKKKLGKKAVKK